LAIGFSITLGILWVDMGIFMGWLWFWIGFTLKIFLSNFIAGIMMVTQGSYHNGDIIDIGGKVWKICRINALFSEVEQFDGVIFYIPNIKFLEENVSNFHTNDKRRVEVDVWVDYDTDITKAKKIMLQVVWQFPHVLQAPASDIFVTELWDNGINLSLRFWVDSKTGNFFQTKSNVTETINLAFKQAGIVIPFPQVTLSNREWFNTGK
jgi:small conductance mechanosensitive channel